MRVQKRNRLGLESPSKAESHRTLYVHPFETGDPINFELSSALLTHENKETSQKEVNIPLSESILFLQASHFIRVSTKSWHGEKEVHLITLLFHSQEHPSSAA